jgi:lipopolysaccharide transport system ATP-binding protein
VIAVSGISKRFRLYRSPADRLKEIVLRRPFHTDFQALADISFRLEAGRSLGVIGPNGAGKSTLLKILAGTLLPDCGRIDVANHGRIGLLAIGAGFNNNLSGLDNIHLSGLLLGMSPAEIAAKRQAIIDFTELGEFIHEPVKTYSSGMQMRLGFSIAIHSEPACFIVDEALSVGDAYFSAKCLRRITEYKARGGSLILVSHDMNAVKLLTDEALLLHRGRIIEQGPPDHVANAYNFLLAKMSDDADPQRVTRNEMRRNDASSFGSYEARIESVSVTGQASQGDVLAAGEDAIISIRLTVGHDPIPDATVGILIRDRFGQDIFGTNTHLLACSRDLAAHSAYVATFRMPMNIGIGKYSLTVALHSGRDHVQHCYHWFDHVARFEVAGIHGSPFIGIAKLPVVCELLNL